MESFFNIKNVISHKKVMESLFGIKNSDGVSDGDGVLFQH